MAVSFLGAQAVESGAVASSRPISVASGTINAKGVYATPQFTATTFPAAWVLIDLVRGTAPDALLDVAVGAAGVEQIVIPNLAFSLNSTTSPSAASYLFPLSIPAGSRVACRMQASVGGVALDTQITLFAPMFGSERGLGQVEACGAVTATSLGTSVDPGGTANTKGTPWTQLIAATSFAYKWACLSVNHTNALAAQTSWTVDIGVGASTAEVVVVPDLAVHGGSVADTNPAIGLCFPCAIPAGTRVSARCQCSVNTASERLLEIVLHGVG